MIHHGESTEVDRGYPPEPTSDGWDDDKPIDDYPYSFGGVLPPYASTQWDLALGAYLKAINDYLPLLEAEVNNPRHRTRYTPTPEYLNSVRRELYMVVELIRLRSEDV
jgi:hypothetical protein